MNDIFLKCTQTEITQLIVRWHAPATTVSELTLEINAYLDKNVIIH